VRSRLRPRSHPPDPRRRRLRLARRRPPRSGDRRRPGAAARAASLRVPLAVRGGRLGGAVPTPAHRPGRPPCCDRSGHDASAPHSVPSSRPAPVSQRPRPPPRRRRRVTGPGRTADPRPRPTRAQGRVPARRRRGRARRTARRRGTPGRRAQGGRRDRPEGQGARAVRRGAGGPPRRERPGWPADPRTPATTRSPERYGRPVAEVSQRWRPFRTWAAVHLRALREQRTHEIGG
jgi:hypothetical protein